MKNTRKIIKNTIFLSDLSDCLNSLVVVEDDYYVLDNLPFDNIYFSIYNFNPPFCFIHI